MGKKTRPVIRTGGGGAQKSAGAKPRARGGDADDIPMDEVEAFHDKKSKREEAFLALDGRRVEDSDEDDAEPVFNLDVGDDSDDDEEDDDEEEEDEEDGDEEEDAEEEDDEEDDEDDEDEDGFGDDDDDDDEDELGGSKFGRKKRLYYGGDTADLEIGQSVNDAEAEEKLAIAESRRSLARLDQSNFALDDDDDDEEEEDLPAAGKRKRSASGGAAAAERVARDVSALPAAERKRLVLRHAPELRALLGDVTARLGELEGRVKPLVSWSEAQDDDEPPAASKKGGAAAKKAAAAASGGGGGSAAWALSADGASFVAVKQQLLLAYLTNLTYFLLLKASGEPTREHPVRALCCRCALAHSRLRFVLGGAALS